MLELRSCVVNFFHKTLLGVLFQVTKDVDGLFVVTVCSTVSTEVFKLEEGLVRCDVVIDAVMWEIGVDRFLDEACFGGVDVEFWEDFPQNIVEYFKAVAVM